MIPIAGRVLRQAVPRKRPTEHVDDVRAMLVHDHCRALTIKIIRTSTDEPIAFAVKVGDHRRYIGMTGKPRLNRMLIGGHHIDQMVRHQRSHMSAHQVLKNWIGERRRQEKEYDAGGERGATDAAEGTLPERRRSPARESLP